MKESLEAALRHSRKQTQSTYDRRTANEKKALALELARSRAEQQEGEGQVPTQDEETASQHPAGDFVGLLEEESSMQQPRVLLGHLHSVLPGGQASLLWYKSVWCGSLLPGNGWKPVGGVSFLPDASEGLASQGKNQLLQTLYQPVHHPQSSTRQQALLSLENGSYFH